MIIVAELDDDGKMIRESFIFPEKKSEGKIKEAEEKSKGRNTKNGMRYKR